MITLNALKATPDNDCASFAREESKSWGEYGAALVKALGFGSAPRVGSKARFTILGKSVSSVLRWMAVKGWDFQSARNALDLAGCQDVSDVTIRCQMAMDDNDRPVRGKPARLTKEQAAELTMLA